MNSVPGLLPCLLERYLLDCDELLLERVLRDSGLDQAEPWVSAGTYPEAEFRELLAAAAAGLQVDPQQLLHDASCWAVPLLLRRFDSLVAGLVTPLELLEAMGETVYPQLCRMLRCASQAQYGYTRSGPQSCTIRYASERQLCAAVEGGLAGLANHFGVALRLQHPRCQRRGDPHCEIDLDFNGVTS